MESKPGNIGIVVGGGPAPGINSVIAAATIRARLAGRRVIAIREGFQHLMGGDTTRVEELTIEKVTPVHFRGGSCIGTSRANPTRKAETLANTVGSLLELGIGQLITIGGDDTLYTAHRVAEAAGGRIAVVHVPKTIDNDLDLPRGTPTFGYQTARHLGCELVKNLVVDAKTTGRWYFVIAMGRTAGHLALGIGKAVGATITLIPEEFPEEQIRLSEVVDTLAGAFIKRRTEGRTHGVAVIAEGLIERMSPVDLDHPLDVDRDPHGHIRLGEVELGKLLKSKVEARIPHLSRGRGPGREMTANIVAKDIGYELRCADPIPFDLEYTRDLGYCAAKYLLDGGTRTLITLVDGMFQPVPFADLMDPATGRTRVRRVDIYSDRYRIARRYMIRLRRDDFTIDSQLERLSETVGLSPNEFREQFEYLTRAEPPAIDWSA